MAQQLRQQPPPVEGVNFGDLGFYTGGFVIPEGDYALTFGVQMFAGTKADGSSAGAERLGVMVGAHPLAGGDAIEQFYSMGGKANLSFAPNAETGKGIVPIPGGQGGGLNNKTNWAILLQSLYDSGLPPGIFTNDLSVLDGVHVHVVQIPEPEERKGFAAASTGEAAEVRQERKIAVVSEIKEDGKPWEGGGGIPDATAKPKGKVAPKPVAGKALVKAAPKAAAPAPVEAAADDDLEAVALNATATVLESNPSPSRLQLRTGAFKAAQAAGGDDAAQAVLATYFASDAALNALLSKHGYGVKGTQIVPA